MPFDDPEWIFELKYDGFRALAVIERGRAQLLSRNGQQNMLDECFNSGLEIANRLKKPLTKLS